MLADLRHAVRLLLRAPAFTAGAIITLAVGIGANVAVFTFVDAVLFRPLPFVEPDRLVSISETHHETGQDRAGVLPGSFTDWRERSRSFEALAMYARATVLVTNRDDPARVHGATVSPGFFEVLGVAPVLGRSFPASDGAMAGHEREIVISHGLWQRWFGGNPGVLGQALQVNGAVPLTIVGVMPEGFALPRGADIWHGLVWEGSFGRGDRSRQALGRLRPGVTIGGAAAELRQLSSVLAAEHPGTNAGWIAVVDPLDRAIVGAARPPLAAMLVAVGLVFLIACVNVATLVLQRGIGRRRELAMRAALGASRFRLARQSVAEHALLALAGSAAGGLLGLFILDLLVALAPSAIPRLDAVAIDGRVIGYLVLLAVVTMGITGLLPALRSSRADATSVLRSGPGGSRPGRGGRAFVVVELALALVLLAGAGLMIRTMLHLQRVDLGFEPEGVTSTELALPMTRMVDGPLVVGVRPAWDRLALYYGEVVAQVESLPGVRRAALVSAPTLEGRTASSFARTGIVPPRSDGSPEWRPIQRRVVTPAYFDVLRLPVLSGRPFSADDHAMEFLRTGKGRRRGTAIVNQEAAKRLWPAGDAIGRTLTLDGDSRVDGRVVVGVVADARDLAPDLPPAPIVYVPFAENPGFSATLVVRAADGILPAADIRKRLRAHDAVLMIGAAQPLEEIYATALAPRRFIAVVLAVFAGAGLVLTAVGLYGVVAMSVAARTRELGIRMALGASWRGVRGLVLREAASLMAAGTALGALGAAASASFLRNQLVGVQTVDAVTWAGAIVVLGAAALGAAWIPARRAARVDPIEVLRHE
jgi:putative ABC transport system permease protein